jgi:hypothetical protein
MRSRILVILLLASINVYAQTNYRTRASGDWNNASTWQVETPNGSMVWITASSSPDFNDNTIILRNGHTITIGGDLIIDQTSINSGATLQILDGVNVTVNNGVGVDLFQFNGSDLYLQGESNLSGAGYFYSGGDVHVHSVNESGAITAGTGATGNIRVATRYYGASCIIYYEGSAKQYIGSGHPGTNGVATVINNANGVEINNTASTSVTFSGSVQISSGELTVANDNLTANQAITIDGGGLSFTNSSGIAKFHSINSLVLVNGDASISTNETNAAISISFSNLIDLTGGNLAITSGNGNAICNFYGDISGVGLINAQGNNNQIRFYGSNSFTHNFPIAQNSNIKFLTVDRPGLLLEVPYAINVTSLSIYNGSLTFSTNQILTGPLNLASGTSLDFSNVTLELRSTVNSALTGGVLNSNASSNLILNGSTSGASTLAFGLGSSLNSLTINRIGGGNVTVSNSVSIVSALNLTTSSLINAGIIMASGATVNRTSSGSASGNVFVGGPYNLVYTGSNLTTGIEAQGALNNITSNVSGTVNLSSAITAVGDLTVNSGTFTATTNAISVASFTNAGTFNAPTSTFTLSGNFTNNGTFNSGTGTVLFNGSSTQNIAGSNPSQFSNITLSNDASVSVESAQSLRGVLTLGANATFDADGAADSVVFTILSVDDIAGSDGSIAALPNGASVTGNVNVQRYWSTLDDVYRYISSPVANSPISQLQDSGIPITGGFDGTSFPCDGCDNDYINLGWYDETVTGYIWEGYQIMPSSGNDNSEELVPGRGYELYMWNGVAPTVWTTRGTVNQGSYPLEVSRTLSTPPLSTEDGWNMVGNPYPSSISWNDNIDLPGGWSMSNIDPVVWVWDVAAGAWKFFDASTNSGDLPEGKIATGQAFWVYATGSSPSLTVHEAAKTSVSGAYYRQRENTSLITITVTGNGSIKDNAYLAMSEETGYANVPKFSRGVEAISLALSSEDGNRLARFSMPTIVDEIPVSVVFKNEGEYEFSFASSDESSLWDSYNLVDRYLNKVISIQSTYTFSVTKNPQTFENRFYISRNPEQTFANEEVIVSAYPNPTTSNLTVEVTMPDVQNVSLTNNVGQVIRNNQVTYTEGVGSTSIEMETLPKGVYFVKVVNADRKVYIQKVLKQ